MSDEATLDDFAQQDGDSEKKSSSAQSKVNLSRLEEYISIIKGTKPDRVRNEQHDDSEPYLVVSTLAGEERKYTPDTNGPKATPQDTLMIMDGSKSGRVYYGEDGVIGSTMAAIRPEDTNSHYLRYFLESNFERLNSATKGSAVPHTDKDLLRGLEYPVYPLLEQRKIATVLYTVDRAIDKNEQISQKANEVEEASKAEFFTRGYSKCEVEESAGWRCRANRFPKDWEVKPAEELMKITRGASPRPRSDDSLFGGEIPWIKIGDAERGVSKRIEQVDSYVTEKGKEKSKFVEEGTLLVANSGATCGFSVFAGVDGCVHDGWLILREYDGLVADFLYHYINWNYDYLQSLSLGSAQTNLSTGLFGRLDIPIPPIQEQRQIVEALDSINQIASHTSKEVSQLKRLKRGLMQDLLSGTVKTTDTNIQVPDEIAQYG